MGREAEGKMSLEASLIELLPDGRGDELVTRLRERDPNLSAIVMSGYCEGDSPAASGRGTWPGQFLQKPFNIETLGRAPARALDREPISTP